jgi:hypothetical protein
MWTALALRVITDRTEQIGKAPLEPPCTMRSLRGGRQGLEGMAAYRRSNQKYRELHKRLAK